MLIIDNLNTLLGDDLKASIKPQDKLKVAASCFSIYAYEALKSELSKIDSLEFIFTAPTFLPTEVTDKFRKEHREFFIPKVSRERSLYGSEFEIQLRNQLTQRAIARECADWIKKRRHSNQIEQKLRCSNSPAFREVMQILCTHRSRGSQRLILAISRETPYQIL